MTVLEALAILEAAVLECKKRNVNTLDASAALDFVAAYVRPKLSIAEFRYHIAREHDREEQQKVLCAAFPRIRDSIRELIGQEMNELKRDFPDKNDIGVKNAIACLAEEYRKLGEPWVFRS